jgi:hypothetical protein
MREITATERAMQGPPYENERDPTLLDAVLEVISGIALGLMVIAIVAMCALEVHALLNPWS